MKLSTIPKVVAIVAFTFSFTPAFANENNVQAEANTSFKIPFLRTGAEATTSADVRARLPEAAGLFKARMGVGAGEDRKDNDQKREDFVERKASTTPFFRANLRASFKRDEFRNYKGMFIQRLDAAIERLESISAKIGNRIDAAKDDGKDVDAAVELHAEAQEKIVEAKADVQAVKDYKPDADATAEAEISATKARELGDKAIESIREAHTALIKVVASLSKSFIEAKLHATSSVKVR